MFSYTLPFLLLLTTSSNAHASDSLILSTRDGRDSIDSTKALILEILCPIVLVGSLSYCAFRIYNRRTTALRRRQEHEQAMGQRILRNTQSSMRLGQQHQSEMCNLAPAPPAYKPRRDDEEELGLPVYAVRIEDTSYGGSEGIPKLGGRVDRIPDSSAVGP